MHGCMCALLCVDSQREISSSCFSDGIIDTTESNIAFILDVHHRCSQRHYGGDKSLLVEYFLVLNIRMVGNIHNTV